MTPAWLQERLLARARAGHFGHFYVFQGRPGDRQEQLTWLATLIRRYWSEVEGRKVLPQKIQDDADLLWLTPPTIDDDEVVDYKVEDLGPLWRFLPYKGLASRRRFVVIEDAHRINQTLANKLLKTLEEPNGEVSFLWANPLSKKLLSTIASRAQTLPLSWPGAERSSASWEAIRTRFTQGDYPLADFLEDGKKGQFALDELVLDMLGHEQQHEGQAAYQQELLNFINEWQRAEVFNQSQGTSLLQIHQLLSQRFRVGR